MSYVAARFIEMLNDTGTISADTYVYATSDVGQVDLMRADAIDTEWRRFLNSGGVISPFKIPTVTGIAPNTAIVGDPDLTLTCSGADFTPDSMIYFNGSPEETTFVSSGEITTIVKPSTAWHEGATVPVLVQTGEWKSAAYDFTFTPAAGRSKKK